MRMIAKGPVLPCHAKICGFVEPNAEDVHFVGDSAIVFLLTLPVVGSPKRSEGIKKFPINLSNFLFSLNDSK